MNTSNNKARILLVEDDASLGFVIKDNLEQDQMEVWLCEDGEIAFETFSNNEFDICILDIMLPKLDGFTLAQKIRSMNKAIPIIFLTAKSMKEDKLNGFLIGADDYIVKPFNIEELLMRIKVFLKRSNKTINSDFYTINSYVFDYKNLELRHEKKKKQLTQKEADLLKLLCDQKDKMIKRDIILKTVWGSDDYFAGRSMDVFISKLRKYLVYDNDIEIINYHGIGFKFKTD